MLKQSLPFRQAELTYQIVTSQSSILGADQIKVYGIRVTASGELNCFAELEDISTDIHDVERLLFKLKKGRVTPDQLKYIVEDFLAEQHMPL